MSPYRLKKHVRDNRGQTLVEFALSAILLVMLLIGVVEMCRMVLVYNSLSDAARVGVRYAMVHGKDNAVSPTGDCTSDPSSIECAVDTFLSGTGTSSCANGGACVTVSYPGPASCGTTMKSPGCPVQVRVSYVYQPMTNYFPLSITLSSTSEGVITF